MAIFAIDLVKNINHIFAAYGDIEKIIHVSWKNKNIIHSDYSIIKNGILKLKELNPDYEFRIYDDADIEEYLKAQLNPRDYELIRRRRIVEKTDLWRLLVLYNEGGFYQDIDRLCNIPLSSIIKPETKCLLPMYLDADFSQDIMCSCPKNIIYKTAIELNLERRRNGVDNIYHLGPVTYFNAITKVFLGRQLNRDPPKSHVELLRYIINNSPYLETYREDPPFNTMLYQGPAVSLDKDLMYANEKVSHWSTYWLEELMSKMGSNSK